MDTVKKYAPDDFIVGYRISPEEIHGENIGYTWHESTQLIDQITKQYGLDYIHLSMPQFDAKPGDAMLLDTEKADTQFKDSTKTFAELFKPVLNGAKEIIVGNIQSQDQAEAAAQLADLVAVGRATLVDPLFAEKVLTGHADQIVHEVTVDQVKKNHMTQGLIDNYSGPAAAIPLPGAENIKSLHKEFGGWSEMKYPQNAEMK